MDLRIGKSTINNEEDYSSPGQIFKRCRGGFFAFEVVGVKSIPKDLDWRGDRAGKVALGI